MDKIWLKIALINILFKVLETEAVEFNESAVGTQLYCYVCLEDFKKRSYTTNTTCQNPVNNIRVIQCGYDAKYCKVERLQLHGVMISIERACTDKCYYGCKFNGFGLMYERCTSCCRARGCNTDSGGTQQQPIKVVPLIIISLIMYYFSL